jgi:hypothetical protein
MKKIILLLYFSVFANYTFCQNIGIGISDPHFKLTVKSLAFGIVQTDGTVDAGIYTDGATGQFGTRTNHPLHFFTNNGSPQLSLLQNGNFGVGINAPQTNLHINPNGAGSILIGSNKNSGGFTNIEMGISKQTNGYGYIQSTKTSGTSYGSLVLNPIAGNVGIGTTTPTSTLDVHGGISLPIKVVNADYTAENNDYTIVVDMQNDITKIINIYLPPRFVNNGRIIKIVPLNMESVKGYDGNYPDQSINLINIYDSSGTVLCKTIYNRYREEMVSVISQTTGGSDSFFHTRIFEVDQINSVTLQCIATTGWIVTDVDINKDGWTPL